MKYYAAQEFIRDKFYGLISERLCEIYGDIFVHNTTTDKEIYENTNGNQYSFYIVTCNKIMDTISTPSINYMKLYRSDPNNHPHIQKMYDDFKLTSEPLKWLIENICYGY